MGTGQSSRIKHGGFRIDQSYAVVSDLNFAGTNYTGTAIEIRGTSSKCRIRNLTIKTYKYGVHLNDPAGQHQLESIRVGFCGSGAEVGAGIFVSGGCEPTLIGCNVHNCHKAPGFLLKGETDSPCGEVRMISCRAQHCSYGLKIDATEGTVFESYFDNLSLSWNGWRDPSKRIFISAASHDSSANTLTLTFTTRHFCRTNSAFSIGQDSELTSDPGLVLNEEVKMNTHIQCIQVNDNSEIDLHQAVFNVPEDFTMPSGTIDSTTSWLQPAHWDLYVEGSETGGSYDLWFTQCNINSTYIKDLREARFNNSRLKHLIYFDSSGWTCNNVFFGNRRGRSADGSDIIPHGPGAANTGAWGSFEMGRNGGLATNTELNMQMPRTGSATNADGTPQDFMGIVVKRNGIEFQGIPVAEPDTVGEIWQDDGTLKIKT